MSDPTVQYDLGRLKKSSIYVDVNPQLGDGPEVLTDVQAINSGIANLLSTPVGSCGPVFNPRYGGMLIDFLQEPIDDVTASRIRVSLFQAIDSWETRIDLVHDKCRVLPDVARRGYRIILVYNTVSGMSGSVDFNVVMG